MTVTELRLYANAGDPGTSLQVGVVLPPTAGTRSRSRQRVAESCRSPRRREGEGTLEEVRTFVEDIETNVIFIDLVNLANHALKDSPSRRAQEVPERAAFP